MILQKKLQVEIEHGQKKNPSNLGRKSLKFWHKVLTLAVGFTVQLPFKLYHDVRTKTASHPSKSRTFSFALFYCFVFYFILFYFVLLCFGFLVYFFLGHFFLMYSTLVNTVVLNVLYKST